MVGVVDSLRISEVMDNLLSAIVNKDARFAILDLTGVEAVDTRTAGDLIEMIKAIRLLGAEGIITGIRSNVAQTMIALGLDLSGVTTVGNLRAGLKLCMRRMAAAGEAGSAPVKQALVQALWRAHRAADAGSGECATRARQAPGVLSRAVRYSPGWFTKRSGDGR
ncbi:STAS domain-containing protein [Sorangium sp. So ce1128]